MGDGLLRPAGQRERQAEVGAGARVLRARARRPSAGAGSPRPASRSARARRRAPRAPPRSRASGPGPSRTRGAPRPPGRSGPGPTPGCCARPGSPGSAAVALRYCAIASARWPVAARAEPKLLWTTASPGFSARACFSSGMRRLVLALVHRLRGDVDEPVVLGRPARRSAEQAVRRDVHELGDVHRAVGRRAFSIRIGRPVVALLVDVRQEHLRVGRAALRGEHQPAAVRARSCARSSSAACCSASAAPRRPRRARCRACCRDASAGRCAPARRRSSGRRARPWGSCCSCRCAEAPAIGSGLAAPAVVEGDAVEVVLDLASRSDRWRTRPASRPRDRRPCASARAKTRYLPSGLQTRVRLHVARVVGAGQRLQHARSPGCTRPGSRASGRTPAGSGSP